MVLEPGILACGPWEPDSVRVSWKVQPYEPDEDAHARADAVLAALEARGSPTHDGLAARLASVATEGDTLRLELQPVRWALRLIDAPDAQSLSALCVVRDVRGRWLAGRRAPWLASWAGRWALGAGGSVEVGENPADTLARELEEEWAVAPERLRVALLEKRESGLVMFIGMAWLPPGASVTADDEHDAHAWWPADLARWPPEADEPLRRIAHHVLGSC